MADGATPLHPTWSSNNPFFEAAHAQNAWTPTPAGPHPASSYNSPYNSHVMTPQRLHPVFVPMEKLSLKRDNWRTFASKVENQLGKVPGAIRFLVSPPNDPNYCPSAFSHPLHHRAWMDTNTIVLVFLRDVLSVTERSHIKHCEYAQHAWGILRYRHLARGPSGQVKAMQLFAAMTYASDLTTFAATTELLTHYNERIWQCSPPDPELFLLSGILSALKHATMLEKWPNQDLNPGPPSDCATGALTN
ncbi:hypothetical protein B0H10DRAFT_2221078 [Mycena sp. CBHHK59/15]|nr:hypothetical protein B0H10DRAFT_2221078 [Mycena sp. CBHHK59/15]